MPLRDMPRKTIGPVHLDRCGVVVGFERYDDQEGGDRIVWHNGGTAGFRRFAAFDPVRGVGAVVLSNSAHEVEDIALHLINNRVPLAAPGSPSPMEIEVAIDIMERYVGVYDLAPGVQLTVTMGDSGLEFQATARPSRASSL